MTTLSYMGAYLNSLPDMIVSTIPMYACVNTCACWLLEFGCCFSFPSSMRVVCLALVQVLGRLNPFPV